jgi:asparagine synthase (glutamine-hydrolysing)
MNRLGGAYWSDNSDRDQREEARICEALGSRTTSPPAVYRQPGVVFVSANPQQVAVSRNGTICCWDGALHCEASDQPAAMALELYERCGPDGLARLIGDWSVAIWDVRSNSILLASDFAGIRPLYFHHTAGVVRWSTSLSDLRRWSDHCELDEAYVGQFLMGCSSAGRTPFRDIEPVPPGGYIRISQNRLERGHFWHMPSGVCVRHRDTRDYAAQLLAHFQDSIRWRIGGSDKICAELSGGLDSSSIVCMAYSLIAGPAASSKLITLSYLQPDSIDVPFIGAVERFCGFDGVHLELNGSAVVSERSLTDGAPALWVPRFEQVKRQLDAVGARTLMTGQLGDLMMGNGHGANAAVLDQLLARRPWRALGEAFAWSGSSGVPVWSILGSAIRDLVMPPAREKLLEAGNPGRDLLTASFARRLESAGAFRSPGGRFAEVSPERRWLYRATGEVLSSRVLQCPETLLNIQWTHPYAHRPLLEFMLSVPPSIVSRPGLPRSLMRQALSSVVPQAVLHRRSKASYDTIFFAGCRPLARRMLSDPAIRLVEMGYVDDLALRKRLLRFVEGVDAAQSQFRNVILMEFWLRQQERSAEESVIQPGASVAVFA